MFFGIAVFFLRQRPIFAGPSHGGHFHLENMVRQEKKRNKNIRILSILYEICLTEGLKRQSSDQTRSSGRYSLPKIHHLLRHLGSSPAK